MAGQALNQGSAVPISVLSAETQQTKKKKKKTRGPQQTLVQMRGIIPVWNYYFEMPVVNGKKKRMKSAERAARWETYKCKMIKEFKRPMNKEFDSERTLIQRYTNPLKFLKYKTGKIHSLDPSELDDESFEYYKEIGGTDDVHQMLLLDANIDGLEAATRNLPRKRKHDEMIEIMDDESTVTMSSQNENNDNRNHNRNGSQMNEFGDVIDEDYDLPQNSSALNTTVTSVSSLGNVPIENIKQERMDTALNTLRDGLKIYERELLDKKKTETFELFQEKMRAVEEHASGIYREKPELIGAMVGASPLKDQLNIAFDLWVSDNIQKIKERVWDLKDFWDQILAAREADEEQWNKNLSKWKFKRIVLGNEFDVTWNFIVTEFGVEERPQTEVNESEQKTD